MPVFLILLVLLTLLIGTYIPATPRTASESFVSPSLDVDDVVHTTPAPGPDANTRAQGRAGQATSRYGRQTGLTTLSVHGR